MKNWKTTLFGILTAAGLAMAQSDNVTVKNIGSALSAISILLFGLFAKDSSNDTPPF